MTALTPHTEIGSRPRSVDDAELGHLPLLFCRGRQRNVQRFITHVHSYCFAHLFFCDVLVAVVVVVCLSSLFLSHRCQPEVYIYFLFLCPLFYFYVHFYIIVTNLLMIIIVTIIIIIVIILHCG